MVRKKREQSTLLEIGKSMPTLYHTIPNEEFDWDKSQVLNWIANQPSLLTYLKYKLSRIGYIQYDATTGTWKGIDVHD